ncbi:MAG: beta-lactamase family protein [Chloroflexi bacterium]|nr:beta-lactamase family protein [Chloroflexota bacterium]
MTPSRPALVVDPRRLSNARALLDKAVEDGAFAGAVALIALDGRVAAHWAIGHAQLEPDQRPMQLDTIFDLASLTKPVAGATAALLLLEEGAWSLDDAVASFIPEFAARGKQEVTLRHLLTHSAGFGGWLPTYAHARDPESALSYICTLPLTYLPGNNVQYSDLGFSMIGHLVRRVTGQRLDALLDSRVWQPLGMADTGYLPPESRRPRIAATERGNRYEQSMVRSLGESFDGWRDHVLVGEVNDGNTYYALDGVSSHAGLFSSAADLLKFAMMYLGDGPRILSPATIAEATSNHTVGSAKARGVGWELPSKGRQPREEWAPSVEVRRVHPAARSAMPAARAYGDLLSARAFGHTGFTGTSLAVDPERRLVIILPSNDRIGTVRPRFHNLVAASVLPPREQAVDDGKTSPERT